MVLLATLSGNSQVNQWRGELRDGHFRSEKNLLKAWPQDGPELLLKKEGIGTGYSSPVLVDGTLFVTGMKDTLDYLTAMDLTGKVLWQVSYGRSWAKSFPDTRSTPTVDGSKVYVLSGTGQMSCYNTADGTLVWSENVDEDYQGEWHVWGVAETPLIIDDKVICSPGGESTSIVAFDKNNGKEIWRTPSIGGPRSYVSPALYEYNGLRYILASTGTHLAALKPETGEVVWTYRFFGLKEWDQTGLIWANTPVWHGRDIYLSKGYDYPSVMITMNEHGTEVTEKFRNEVLDNHHHGIVLIDGKVYASNWINNGKGNWVCMDWNTGEIHWETEWENKGSAVYADGLLYLYEERRGNVALVRPNPEKFELISTFRITDGTGPHWAHPMIADGKLLIRHGDVLMVYNIAG
jgi:outer membrane protein assembly factor BamB